MNKVSGQGSDGRTQGSQGSISEWIDNVRGGNEAASGKLWDRYFGWLCQVARHKLGRRTRQISDEEDIALSALGSVLMGLERGKLSNLKDRQSLQAFLIYMVARKLNQQIRYETARKRDMMRTARDASNLGDSPITVELSDDARQETVAMIGEFFSLLPSDLLKNIALATVQGYTTNEIASLFGVSSRTIERKLRLIRTYWEAKV